MREIAALYVELQGVERIGPIDDGKVIGFAINRARGKISRLIPIKARLSNNLPDHGTGQKAPDSEVSLLYVNFGLSGATE
jgi:hypothetical protein